MCLAVSGKILNIEAEVALVDFGNEKKQINLDLLPEAKIDDYILIHAGFAISKIKNKEVMESIRLFKQKYDEE